MCDLCTPLIARQRDRQLQESLRLLNNSPAARIALTHSSSQLRDPTVRDWFSYNGLPVDETGSVEM